MRTQAVTQAYKLARERYAQQGVDTERAIKALARIPISLHCWQGDDVGGFENSAGLTGGGIQATGNYPGKARNADELRADLEEAMKLIPGALRLNLHALYAETGGKKVERDGLGPEHFRGWLDWAKSRKVGVDFNPSYFSHPLAASGFTLTHADEAVRRFWVRHGIACRKIGAWFGRKLGNPCVTNLWIPDGHKDTPVDRAVLRRRLEKSLDEIFAAKISPRENLDAVESKLFGIGSESYVVGSHEFYMGYAITRQKLLTLDAGHFHPTESIADKISSMLMYVPGLLLHVSRGVRWDSDHVVTVTDDLAAIAQEIVRSGQLDRIHIGLDYFDASINRIAAWTIGTRAMSRALLMALLEPAKELRALEASGDFTSRLALLEEAKALPGSAVWDYYCLKQGVPIGRAWLAEVKRYEAKVLARR